MNESFLDKAQVMLIFVEIYDGKGFRCSYLLSSFILAKTPAVFYLMVKMIVWNRSVVQKVERTQRCARTTRLNCATRCSTTCT